MAAQADMSYLVLARLSECVYHGLRNRPRDCRPTALTLIVDKLETMKKFACIATAVAIIALALAIARLRFSAKESSTFSNLMPKYGKFEIGKSRKASTPSAFSENPVHSASLLADIQEIDELLIYLTEQLAVRDPEAVAEWAMRLPEEANRSEVIVTVAVRWAEKSPVDAGRFAMLLSRGRAQNEAVKAVGTVWARRDSRAAAEWASALPSADLQGMAYERVLLAWAERDPLAAVEWLVGLPDSVARDEAASTFCGTLGLRHPKFALLLAQSLSRADLRARRTNELLSVLQEPERESARQALTTLGITLGDIGP